MNTSYNNDPQLKRDLIEEMKGHIKADRLIKGDFGEDGVPIENFRGCSVGCSIVSLNRLTGKEIESDDHDGLAEALGLPDCGWLTLLQDHFFENLPEPDHQQWSLDFLEAIPVGVSEEKIQLVKWQFLAAVLTDTLTLPTLPEDVRSVIARVRDLCALPGKGEEVSEEDWNAAAHASYAAARAAGEAADAVHAAARAARAAHAAHAVAYAADAVARAAANAASYAANAAASRKWASRLLELLRATAES